MSRIEKGADTKEQLQQMKGEVIKEIGSTKKFRPWMTCSLIFFLFVCFGIAAILWAVAATGLVVIPGVTTVAYREPQPSYEVTPGIPVETFVSEQIKTQLVQKLQTNGETLKDTSMSFTLPESSLTASLRTIIKETADSLFDHAHAQVSITKEQGFTLFLPLQNSNQHTAVQVSFKAEIVNGVIELMPESALIGSLPISGSLLTFLFQPFLQDRLQSLSQEIRSFVELDHIEYQDGSVQVVGKLSVTILEIQPAI